MPLQESQTECPLNPSMLPNSSLNRLSDAQLLLTPEVSHRRVLEEVAALAAGA